MIPTAAQVRAAVEGTSKLLATAARAILEGVDRHERYVDVACANETELQELVSVLSYEGYETRTVYGPGDTRTVYVVLQE